MRIKPTLAGHWGRRFAAALLPLLLCGCGADKPDSPARPAMWLVQDDDTRIYLLGTMHALPRGTDWDDGAVAKAIAASDALMMELSPRELAAAGAMFQTLASRPAPLPIEARLSGAALARYRALEASGGALGGDTLDDWAVMILIGQRAARAAALSPAAGVEKQLTDIFEAADKPIGGLESARSQLMLFENLDAPTQRALLTRAAAGADDAVARVTALTAAWRRGDVAALERMINEDVDAVPAARQAIITDRNHRWAAWAQNRLKQPGTVLMAVGAGHLIGADGVPAILETKGMRVTRVQ
ncbi:MAG TPA: TraB/GumN family protein [Sphingopyxis sp.]|uniref:TraB/GumN family protein n=1 Tax=Sphingopyxis sp. TaxID=1908224 RepID=UPI002E0FC359|nr:TraB/GumN family protein [Sphingopyxis sp.]